MVNESLYPDGSTNPKWNSNGNFKLVVPEKRDTSGPKISPAQIDKILCHRRTLASHEQYLVKWKGRFNKEICSWQYLNELSECLSFVQKYLECLPSLKPAPEDDVVFLGMRTIDNQAKTSRKRKFSDDDDASISSADFSASTPASSNRNSPSPYTSISNSSAKSYNGRVQVIDGRYSVTELEGPIQSNDDVIFTTEPLPTARMLETARMTNSGNAYYEILAKFKRQLQSLPGPVVKVTNDVDKVLPPLTFEFVSKSVLGEGVHQVESEFVTGCGNRKGGCRPDMGQSIGCEYSRKCECLELAEVDTDRLNDEDRAALERGETEGLPKKFPYFNANVRLRAGCLVKFYVESRNVIYECNSRCNCGPNCKTRIVQHGRKVPLEIFKTRTKGWGLRCLEDLKEGQFIDTYRGEIITGSEADVREEKSEDHKANYLFTLDKFVGQNGITLEDCYVIDGQNKGGPTRFMNHSCDPNCRIYSVSYNKYDQKVYELAFFAYYDIPKGTELTFDYLDKDDEDAENEIPGSSQGKSLTKAMKCECGSKKCRGRVWV